MKKDEMQKNKKSIYRQGEEEISMVDKYAPNLKAMGQQLAPTLSLYHRKAKELLIWEKVKNAYYFIIALAIVGALFWGAFSFLGYLVRNWGK